MNMEHQNTVVNSNEEIQNDLELTREECFSKILDHTVKADFPRGQMATKLERAKPYNMFMATVTSSTPTHTELLSVSFPELLDISLGEIDSSVHFNFRVDLDWLITQYNYTGNDKKPLLVLYGYDDPDFIQETRTHPIVLRPNVQAIKINVDGEFGIHHTKIMIFCYKDNSLRVIVSTANLYMEDWKNRTEGLWISPKCPELPKDSGKYAGESSTGFKWTLINYLLSYNVKQLRPYIDRIRSCDFSHLNVFLIPSVPGHMCNTPIGPLFGHPRLGYVLQNHSTPIDDSWPIVCQSSSIGILGRKYHNSWIESQLFQSLEKHSGFECTSATETLSSPEFKMIYPSTKNASQSYDIIQFGGTCLHYTQNIHDRQTWINNFLYQWKSDSRHRTEGIPHFKSYCRFKEDKLAWFCLTSANLSRSAWGGYNNQGFRINNYECGVLFLPKFVIEKEFFSLMEFPMPYDIPLTKYEADDEPYIRDSEKEEISVSDRYRSPANLYEDSDGSDTDAGDSATGFKFSLLNYLSTYKIVKLLPYITQLRQCDFREVNVFLISSVPGGHRTTPKGPPWGHPRLGYVLEKHAAPIEDSWPIVCQSSSIGSLGKDANAWIREELFCSFRRDTKVGGLRSIPEFKMIYPSFSNVIQSHDSILGGGCLPYSKNVNDKQPWLKKFLYQWKSKSRHCNQAMPHIKTYFRWNQDKLAWFCLTSANLSKAAWGMYNKTGLTERPLRISNYECGVLFLPRFVIGKELFTLNEFPMPYDIPLTKYGIDDVPFLADLLH